MRDEDLVSGREVDAVVVLQDGRQLDGWLTKYESRIPTVITTVAMTSSVEIF